MGGGSKLSEVRLLQRALLFTVLSGLSEGLVIDRQGIHSYPDCG